jgi:nicotinamidase-related amidase
MAAGAPTAGLGGDRPRARSRAGRPRHHQAAVGRVLRHQLGLQLRRRGIDTILLAGISTNVGVESTARDAYERGYEQVFVEDAMAARGPDEHAHTIRTVFARIGRVRSTAEVLAALEVATGQA